MNSPIFQRVEQCGYCQSNMHNFCLPCAIRLYRIPKDEERCTHFEADPTVLPGEVWDHKLNLSSG
ncbi:hypothetical protein [Leptolyngbya sp. FACHB-16]|uniref:hypothetical protein n=1 Tax=unclassified Leptolyngbya TaxID=2650499 RepID=UPI001686E4B0|nr:hypothetical protein [Leptolyngbya sp. FACHB-16]MBD2158882.1 hypothetical protein [Leptolyngbya sp. FACHB-16]